MAPAKLDPSVFVDAPEVFTITEAAKLLGVHHRFIRNAIRADELEAFVIGGRDPRRAGAGMGYRITRQALQDWFFGKGVQKKENP